MTIVSQVVGARRVDYAVFDLQWYQSLPGYVTITLDGEIWNTGNFDTGQHSVTIYGVNVNSHTICVENICINVSAYNQGGGTGTTIIRKELVTNLTSDETLIKVIVAFGVGGSQTYISKRQEGNNWVFLFEFQTIPNYVLFGAGAGLAKFIELNGKAIAAVLVSLGIVSIVWIWRDAVTSTNETQATISSNDTASISGILGDSTLTSPQKTLLIEEILKKSYGGTDWNKIITTIVIIAATAYILKGKI
jgi:hypothetical protein